jgi:DNA-binding PadR family transcriptional regulator
MAEYDTSRDRIRDAVFDIVRERGSFRRDHLPFDHTKRKTIYRTLRAMEEQGYLFRYYENSSIWRVGPKTLKFIDLTDRARALMRAEGAEPPENLEGERRTAPWEDPDVLEDVRANGDLQEVSSR